MSVSSVLACRFMEVTRGIRNKNPFNIRYSNNSWLGKVRTNKKDKQFEEFRELDYGLRAGVQLLRGYISRGYDTIPSIIKRFAPPTENNTSAYVNYVLDTTGIAPDSHIRCNSLEFYKVCAAVCAYESKFEFSKDLYNHVLTRFHLFGNLV